MSGESLYMSIYDGIVSKILGGDWTENTRLPAERLLCQLHHVSRTTVRRALECLERDDYIVKKHGNGNYVKPRGYKQSLSRFYSFTDELKTGGVIIKNNILHYETFTADSDFAKILDCDIGERFHKITRLRSAGDFPLMLEHTWLPKSRFYRLDVGWLETHSLYEYLKTQYNLLITRSYEVLSPVMPNHEQRSLLNILGAIPCMAVERFSYEEDNLIEYTTSVIRGDKYKFEADLVI